MICVTLLYIPTIGGVMETNEEYKALVLALAIMNGEGGGYSSEEISTAKTVIADILVELIEGKHGS